MKQKLRHYLYPSKLVYTTLLLSPQTGGLGTPKFYNQNLPKKCKKIKGIDIFKCKIFLVFKEN